MLFHRPVTVLISFAALYVASSIAVAQSDGDSAWQVSPEETHLIAQFIRGDDAASSTSPSPASTSSAASEADHTAEDYHARILRENRYPSADTCKTCHPRHYDEWSVSPHAYSQMSPVANAMNGMMQILTQGTIGDFCMRCHSPVSMALEEPIFMSNMDRHPASREGITCVTCHRVDQRFGKVVGRLAVKEGSIVDPVYGPSGNAVIKEVLEDDQYRVTTDPEARGRKIHNDVIEFTYLRSPDFCASCHEVTLVNGARLEETYTEYKHSPAARKGVTCQDCHMGKVPGVASGYDHGPAAVVGGVPTKPRRLTSHLFAGPDHSIIHPGIFPHNADAAEMATIREWLTFDVKAGWGTDDFEDTAPLDHPFPERWLSIDDRYDAREILERQFALLKRAEQARRQLLQTAYVLGEIQVTRADARGLGFNVEVRNGTDGHNAPTGFERMVFLHVTVRDAEDRVIFESGDLDPNGDVRDAHSEYVKNGELPLDEQLFNMQSKFITRNLRGGERAQVLGANFSTSALPFVRPDPNPNILRGRPLGLRLHKKGIEPNGVRWVKYKVKKGALTGSPPYRATVELKAGMIPVNLMTAVKDAGLDYHMTPRELAEAIVEGHQVLWSKEIELHDTRSTGRSR